MTKKIAAILAGILVIVVGAFILIGGGKDEVPTGGDLIIPKSAVSEKARFYPYKAGDIKMEVLAVKAPDGTIRTAFNTCQICYDTGKGYYKQDGDELVCQNCLNRFKTSDVEVIHGGCNPVPILKEQKTDDGENLIIPQTFLESNAVLFEKWK